jgi:hypothetical protein
MDEKIINYGGTAIYLNNYLLLECVKCEFLNNTVNASETGGVGGAILLNSSSAIERCIDCKFNGNAAR